MHKQSCQIFYFVRLHVFVCNWGWCVQGLRPAPGVDTKTSCWLIKKQRWPLNVRYQLTVTHCSFFSTLQRAYVYLASNLDSTSGDFVARHFSSQALFAQMSAASAAAATALWFRLAWSSSNSCGRNLELLFIWNTKNASSPLWGHLTGKRRRWVDYGEIKARLILYSFESTLMKAVIVRT